MCFTCNARNVGIKIELVIVTPRSFKEIKFGSKQSPRVYLGSEIVLDRPTYTEIILKTDSYCHLLSTLTGYIQYGRCLVRSKSRVVDARVNPAVVLPDVHNP